MGIFEKIPNSDKRRMALGFELVIHLSAIIGFLCIAHYLFGIRISVFFVLYTLIVYIIGSSVFHITRSVFKAIDKVIEKDIAEEVNVAIEEVPKKQSRLSKIREKAKTVVTVKKTGTKVDFGGTPPEPTPEPVLPIEAPISVAKLPIEE